MKMFAFFRSSRKYYLLASLGAMWLAVMPVRALDFLDSRVQIHGFFSQGMIKSSDNNFLGDSHNVSFDLREIALNASYRPLTNLQFSAQLMSHFAGNSDTGGVDADYAFADWTIASGEWGRGGIRVGRVKNPYGLLNVTRFIPFARSSIILPQSIYFERTRKVAVSADGFNLYFDWLNDFGTLGFEIVLGWPDAEDKATEVAFYGSNYPGKPNALFTQLYQLKFESADKRLHLAATRADVNYSYSPGGANDPLKAGEFNFNPYIFSAQYEAEKWSLTTEYAVRPTSLNGFSSRLDRSLTGESFYVQGSYRLLPQVELFTRYDVTYANRKDRDGMLFAAATGRSAYSQYAKDLTFGIRYDFNSSVMLRAEYHNVDGTAFLPMLDNLNPNSQVRHWDMWLLLASFRF